MSQISSFLSLIWARSSWVVLEATGADKEQQRSARSWPSPCHAVMPRFTPRRKEDHGSDPSPRRYFWSRAAEAVTSTRLNTAPHSGGLRGNENVLDARGRKRKTQIGQNTCSFFWKVLKFIIKPHSLCSLEVDLLNFYNSFAQEVTPENRDLVRLLKLISRGRIMTWERWDFYAKWEGDC